MIKGRKEIKAWESTGVSNKENSKTIHTYNRAYHNRMYGNIGTMERKINYLL